MVNKSFVLVLPLLFLSACGSSDYAGSDKPTAIKIGKPYVIAGKKYYPHYDENYDEVGQASWYGPGFHGRMTASGEKYNQHGLTAAHTTLPMPSLVKVTRLDNGKSVVVRVNDRGPYESGRILDLSHESATQLGLVGVGVAKVRVQYLSEDTEKYIDELGLNRPQGWGGRSFAKNNKNDNNEEVFADDFAPQRESAQSIAAPIEVVSSKSLMSVSELEPIKVAPAQTIDKQIDEEESHISAAVDDFDGETLPKQIIAAPMIAQKTNNLSKPEQKITSEIAQKKTGNYIVQAGAFTDKNNAQKRFSAITKITNISKTAGVKIIESTVNGLKFYRVVSASALSIETAQKLLEEIKTIGINDARIIVE